MIVLISEMRHDVPLYGAVQGVSRRLLDLGQDVFCPLLNAPDVKYVILYRVQIHEFTMRMITIAEAVYAHRDENPSELFLWEQKLAQAMKIPVFTTLEQAEIWVRNHP